MTDDLNTTWYFAIASMMNKVSLNARSLFAQESRPGELLDYELVFYGSQGMAAAKPCSGKSFHGVLHRLSEEDMVRLDKIEVSVKRCNAKAKLYDGSTIDCCVYCDDWEKKAALGQTEVNNPPEARYLEIMIEGALHFGVSQDYVENVLRKVAVVPRKKAENFLQLEVSDEVKDVIWTEDELVSGKTAKGATPTGDGAGKEPEEQGGVYFAVNGKVVEWTGAPNNPLIQHFKGKDMTLFSARMKYDPKYGLPEKLEDMSSEHRAQIEDQVASAAVEGGPLFGGCRVVGRLA